MDVDWHNLWTTPRVAGRLKKGAFDMPTGPNGEKRSSDVVANAVLSMKIATGEAEEVRVNVGKSAGGRKGGKARWASNARPS